MTRLIALTLLVAILSVVAWWLLLFQPVRAQSAALQVETVELTRLESQLRNQRQQLLDLQARAPQLRSELDRLNDYIPPDPDQARLLEVLQAAGNASGIEFTSLVFTDPLPVNGAPVAPLDELTLGAVVVTGGIEATYFQLMDFLRRLEVGSSRAILVTDVILTEGDNGFPDLTAQFTAQIFALIPAPVDPNAVPEADVEGATVDPASTVAPTPAPSEAQSETSTDGVDVQPSGPDAQLSMAGTEGDRG